MKSDYDFSKAQQGRLYRPAEQLRIPVYLEPDVQRQLHGMADGGAGKDGLSGLVNELLRKQLQASHRTQP